MVHSLVAGWSEEVNTSSLRNYKSEQNSQNLHNISFLNPRNPLFKQKFDGNSPGKWEKWRPLRMKITLRSQPDLLLPLTGLQNPLENHGSEPINWHLGFTSGSQGL